MLAPLPASRWNEVTAAHLLNRAGFGGGLQQIADLNRMGLDRAVSYFVDYDKIPYDPPRPGWAYPDPDFIEKERARAVLMNTSDLETRKAILTGYYLQRRIETTELTYWWLRRMALGPRPFQEKMALFWHGHFPASMEKVGSNYFLYLQNEVFRQNAIGNFAQLLIAVAESPAMLLYLDGVYSHKKKPNENFAREVMELFTLGEGYYTEHDIREAAKAYTGWGLSPDRQRYEYHPYDHDDGPKTIFGKTAHYTGEEVLNVIANRPECARFISGKIWRYFVQDEPPQPVVEALGAELHSHGMDLKHLMNVIFRSEEFYAPDVIRAQIKSPVHWLLSSTHRLEAAIPTEPMSLAMLSQLGQDLFAPPNVKGWVGGLTWITTSSLLDRYNFAAALVEGRRVPLPSLEGQMQGVLNSVGDPGGLLEAPPVDVAALFTPEELSSPDLFLDSLQERFLNGALRAERLDPLRAFIQSCSPLKEADIRKSIRLIMSTPEYQLT